MKYLLSVIIFFICILNVYPQQDGYITVVGDSLVGKVLNGESVREVYGNVVLKQADVVMTCNKAIQYLARNDADLIGNVIVKQDTMTITTDTAYYSGNLKKATSNCNVKLDDKKVILVADSGDYFFDEHKALFKSNVTLYDTSATLTSEKLIYYKDEDRMIAVNNVKIVQEENIITADSLEYFRNKRVTYAYNNVGINSSENNVQIYGDHLEDYAERFYTLIDKNPLLIQIDTSYNKTSDTLATGMIDTILTMKIDTLVIRSNMMEAWRDTINLFKAEDSVRIVRSGFASLNDFTIYRKKEGEIITYKVKDEANQPVLWYNNSQLTGDSVTISLIENQIKLLKVFGNAFILSQNQKYTNRYDQTSSDSVALNFNEGILTSTEIYGNVLSIYYLYEDEEPNGLTRSSSKTAKIVFDDKEVSEVRLYGTPASEFYPEKQVKGKELTFTLPLFKFYDNRPTKLELLEANGRRQTADE